MGKISTNTNLKRRIREFQAQHGVSHSTALKAVDEPLHMLRDLSRISQSMATPDLSETRFRLVGDQGRFASSFYGSDFAARYIRDQLLQAGSMSSPLELMKRISLRFELIEKVGATDIWDLRERIRAGIASSSDADKSLSALGVDSNAEEWLIEPLFYYHEGPLDPRVDHYLSSGEGVRLGIYPLNLQGILELERPGEAAAIPVTLLEITRLLDGSLRHRPRFIQRFSQKPGWTVEQRSYSFMAELKESWGESQVRVFFGNPAETVESAKLRLESIGLDPQGFQLREIRGKQLTLHYAADWLDISGWEDGRSISMRTERTIELDGELAARTYEDNRRRIEDQLAVAMRSINELTKISLSSPNAETVQRIREAVDLRSYLEFEGITTYEEEEEGELIVSADCPFEGASRRLMISSDGKYFKCFGCGEAGDIVSFVQKLKRLNYWDAVGYLTSFEMVDGRLMRRSSRALKL